MKNILSYLLFFSTILSLETKAQLQFENTYGLLVNDPSGITVLRGTVALNNLIPVSQDKENKFNIGVYYTTEICCAFSSKYPKKESMDLLYDLAGISLRFFDRISLYAGGGFFRRGMLSKNNNKRAELGLAYQIKKYNLTISSSLGLWKGPSVNVGYFVKLSKNKGGSGEKYNEGSPRLK